MKGTLENHLVCWVSAHEDLTWPVLVTLLTTGIEMKQTSAPGCVFLHLCQAGYSFLGERRVGG